MSDWSVPVIEPLVTIHPFSLESIGNGVDSTGFVFNSIASAVYPTANLALFIPFSLSKSITIVKLFSYTGATKSGNIDMAIYSEDGTKLTSAAAVAQGTINVLQEFDITDIQIGPGTFYMAVVLDNITGTLRRATSIGNIGPAVHGMAQMANAYPLPVTAVFAQIAGNYIPMIGLSTRVVL